MSAPISRARSMLEMILAVLPAKSPTVGLICASAMRMVVISICHFNRVNNPDNRRVNRPVFQPVGHARAAARHYQHLLTKARADGVDSHQITALVLAGERDRADEQKLFAFKARVFARRHDIADDADRKSTRLNSSHVAISYAVFCLKKKKNKPTKQNGNRKLVRQEEQV